MKKLIIGMLIVLIALVAALAVLGQGSSASLYADGTHADYNQIGDDVVGTNLYYFYQESCVHCNNIKEDIADFYYSDEHEDIDFYFVDAAQSKNSDVWFRGESDDFVPPSGKFTDYTDIQILGTPTLIEIMDGQITQFLVGEEAIPAYLESL
ncbi:hypothetical protein R2F61_00175 [Mollicutes bacterium LVI A0078]|nr:hypothetical protein RZE84_00175 [Mollicutes bacterium LVI A0075]WOO90996.1 hypothetical protein R2F61_00175 [Mollicutes bacterium LVI A0078]